MIRRFLCGLLCGVLCVLLGLPLHLSVGEGSVFAVRRVHKMVGFADNEFVVTAPEAGRLSFTVHDETTVYAVLSENLLAGENVIHWDGTGFNAERLAPKGYQITAGLSGESGQEYEVSFASPLEYNQQALLFALPSADSVSLADPDAWFLELKILQDGEIEVAFFDPSGADSPLYVTRKKLAGGKIHQLSFSALAGKSFPGPGEYRVRVCADRGEAYPAFFDLFVTDQANQPERVTVTGEIMPPDGCTDETLWQWMMRPSVVIDITYFHHQKVYAEPDTRARSLGTLHGQTQAVSVLEISEEESWARVGAWNHESGAYVEGWVPYGVLKVVHPRSEYGLLLDKRSQTLTVFRRGQRVETLQVSTGKADQNHPEQETSAGSFLTGIHKGDFSTNGKKFDYVIQYDGGNLLHQIPYYWGNGKKDFSVGLSGLGQKASHGCVRIQAEPGLSGINAYWLWTHIPYHTRLIILDDQE